ncbi:MAG TPA: hypothetical protein VMU93_01095 [Caulobacteraceae bacterium]|nr:hypothetical protein [Caulobacteraceae bacterium]
MRRAILILLAVPAVALAQGGAPTHGARTGGAAPAARPAAATAPGWAAPPGPTPEPGACQMSCARTRYVCEAGSDGDCGGAWSRCVAGCALPNLDPGVSTAP